jgi:hypothetical protein
VVKGKDLKKAEESDSREAVPDTAEEVQSKTKEVKGELRKEEKFKGCPLIIHILILLLKITVDNFPFGLYYVDLYDRYAKIRRTIRHCLAVYLHNDAYKKISPYTLYPLRYPAYRILRRIFCKDNIIPIIIMVIGWRVIQLVP